LLQSLKLDLSGQSFGLFGGAPIKPEPQVTRLAHNLPKAPNTPFHGIS